WEQFSIRRNGHLSQIRPFPISVAWDEHATDHAPYVKEREPSIGRPAIVRETTREGEDRERTHGQLHRELGIEGKHMMVGVDRLDYTKGIVERLLAIEHLLDEHPWYLEKVVFVQIAAPSRTRIPSYAGLRMQVQETVERINHRFETSKWKPVILIERQCSHVEVAQFY